MSTYDEIAKREMPAKEYVETVLGSTMDEMAEAQEMVEMEENERIREANRRTCAVCGDTLTETEVAALAADTDFVQHGDRGHLIRVAS